MGWKTVTRKVYLCDMDACEEVLADPEFEVTSVFPMDAKITDYDLLDLSDGWALIGGKAYCSKEWHYCEGDPWSESVLGKARECRSDECRGVHG